MLSVEEELIGPIASKRAFVGRCPSVTQKVKGRQPYWSPTCTREDEFTAAATEGWVEANPNNFQNEFWLLHKAFIELVTSLAVNLFEGTLVRKLTLSLPPPLHYWGLFNIANIFPDSQNVFLRFAQPCVVKYPILYRVFFLTKKLKYVKPRFSESTLT